MRCLYCGKELALLKRWTGGGEFCSDAHRQRYQEEYNQLALNRLLQAKPPADAQPSRADEVKETKPAATAVAARSPEPPAAPAPQVLAISERAQPNVRPREDVAVAQAIKSVPEPAAAIEDPPAKPPEVVAPAGLAGFIVEFPVSALARVAAFSSPALELLAVASPAAIPPHQFEPAAETLQETRHLEWAGLLSVPVANRVANYAANNARERRLEVRDFLRASPVVEFELGPAGEAGLEVWSEAVDFSMTPQPPANPPLLWQEPPSGFAPYAAELGDLGRLAFATTGFSSEAAAAPAEPDETGAPAPVKAIAAPAPEPPAEVQDAGPAPVPGGTVLDRSYLQLLSGSTPHAAPALAESQPDPPPAAQAPVESAPELPVDQLPAEPIAESPAAGSRAEQAPPTAVPDAVTAPVAVTIASVLPSKGKAAQVFTAASYGIQAQVPRSTSLPLRPVMTFGPIPRLETPKVAESTPEKVAAVPVAGGQKPPAPPTPAFRPLAVEAPFKPIAKSGPSPAPKEDKKSAAKPDIKADRKTEPRETRSKEEAKPTKAPELVLPAPLAPSYSGTASDLGLPRLSLQPPQGLLARMPLAAKIAVAVVMLAVVGGLIALSSKSGTASSAASREPVVVPGSVLPAGDAGWITDWGADPGVRRTRQISVLRSSQTYTDYRIQMEGQIESKAIGWVFRAADPRNFYVTKLEIVKPGLEPTVALVRFGVINGEEQVHAQIPLPLKVRRDTMFKIRFDAVGNHFTTYVQGEKIDEWTDDRIKTGGVGLYSERGEVASLKGGINVLPLVVRK